MDADRDRCEEVVDVPETYRRNRGQGKATFTLHYIRRRCRRTKELGGRYRWQHKRFHRQETGA